MSPPQSAPLYSKLAKPRALTLNNNLYSKLPSMGYWATREVEAGITVDGYELINLTLANACSTIKIKAKQLEDYCMP
jgi:hypothetical protein